MARTTFWINAVEHQFALTRVLAAARDLRAAHPALHAFAPWPTKLTASDLCPQSIPATDLVAEFEGSANSMAQPLIDAVPAAAQSANWTRTYS